MSAEEDLKAKYAVDIDNLHKKYNCYERDYMCELFLNHWDNINSSPLLRSEKAQRLFKIEYPYWWDGNYLALKIGKYRVGLVVKKGWVVDIVIYWCSWTLNATFEFYPLKICEEKVDSRLYGDAERILKYLQKDFLERREETDPYRLYCIKMFEKYYRAMIAHVITEDDIYLALFDKEKTLPYDEKLRIDCRDTKRPGFLIAKKSGGMLKDTQLYFTKSSEKMFREALRESME